MWGTSVKHGLSSEDYLLKMLLYGAFTSSRQPLWLQISSLRWSWNIMWKISRPLKFCMKTSGFKYKFKLLTLLETCLDIILLITELVSTVQGLFAFIFVHFSCRIRKWQQKSIRKCWNFRMYKKIKKVRPVIFPWHLCGEGLIL